jgi:GcrA cell cycle regulator
MSRGWTEAEITTLKQLWATGKKTADQIGDEIGKSRNAVLGKIHRLKLPGGGSQPRINRVRRTHTRKAMSPKKDLSAKSPKRPEGEIQAAEKIPFVEIIPEDAPTPLGIQVGDLREDTCKWPVGDPLDHENFGFCGHEVSRHGGPYCPYHEHRAHH